MKLMYLPCLLFVFMFLIWVDTHTDELPFILGMVLISTAALGYVFPVQIPFTGALTGLALFTAETLVHYSVLHAPYPPGRGLPWPALFGYVPAILGTLAGAGFRQIVRKVDVP